MGARRTLTRATVAILLTTMTAALLGSPSAAGQPPPDSLEDQIAAADAELRAAQVKLADTYEVFTAAERRHRSAEATARAASDAATRARSDAEAAAALERDTRLNLDRFATASYRQRSTIGSVRAYLGSTSPTDLLDRAALLDVLAGEYTDVLETTRQAVEQKAVAERDARAALDQAVSNRDAAARAKADAERAYQAAVAVQDEAKAETARLAARRAALAAQNAAENPAENPADDSGSTNSSPGQATVLAAGAVVLPAQGRLTSTYGARWGTIHYGIDIANSIGTPIRSAMAGEVIDSGPASGFGLWVRVRHDNGLITVYGHINESLVSVGQRVAAGEQIATMGNRGQSTGPHLHFEVHQGGSKIDPLPWLRGHGVGI